MQTNSRMDSPKLEARPTPKARRKDTRSMQVQLKEAKEDADMMKNLVFRLNSVLSGYRDKYGPPPSEGAGTEWEILKMRRRLMPLLEAYDESLADRDEAIAEYEAAVQAAKVKCGETSAENEELHRKLKSACTKGAISYDEWSEMRDSAGLVLEENAILEEQLQMLREKYDKLASNSIQESAIWQDRTETLEKDAAANMREMALLRAENERLKAELKHTVPAVKHKNDVEQCKQLFEELKINYRSERKRISEQLTASETEKMRLNAQLAEAGAEQIRSESKLAAAAEQLQVHQSEIRELTRRLQECQRSQWAASDYVSDVVQLAEHVLEERASLEKLLDDERENMKGLRLSQDSLFKMRRKLREQRQEWTRRTQRLKAQLEETKVAVKRGQDEHRKEARRLKGLLRHKEKVVVALEAEKSQLNRNLEAVWGVVAAADVPHLKDFSVDLPELPQF